MSERMGYIMERTMVVRGKGTASLAPDYIKVSITLVSQNPEYAVTLANASKQLEQLRACLGEVGFKKEDIKSTGFTVNTEYESVRDKFGNYTQVFVGYSCRQSLVIGFDLDLAKLGAVISALGTCPAKPQFSISFELKDDTKLTDLVLENAVANAVHNASILARAASVDLGEVLTIDYNIENMLYSPRQVMYSETFKEASVAIDIQPDNITTTDYVTMTWRLR